MNTSSLSLYLNQLKSYFTNTWCYWNMSEEIENDMNIYRKLSALLYKVVFADSAEALLLQFNTIWEYLIL